MTNYDKLKYAAKLAAEKGIDPDETMILTDSEFDEMMGIDRDEERLNEELQKLYQEEAGLIDSINELETELIPEAEELVESDSIGEAISEYRSDLSSYRATLGVKQRRLLEVHDQIKAILAILEKKKVTVQDIQPEEPDEGYEQLVMEGFDDALDESSEELAGLKTRKSQIEARIEYIENEEIPLTREARDSAKDYMSKIDFSQDLSALGYELTKLSQELDFVNDRIAELTGLKR